MKGQQVLMSSGDTTGSADWETPDDFFALLDATLGPITLDTAATAKTTKCDHYYSARHDALKQTWGKPGTCWFCNPPYGEGIIRWVSHGAANGRGRRGIMLLPSRTDHRFFHDVVLPHAAWVGFVRGRIQFRMPGKHNGATFPSIVVVFDSDLDQYRQDGMPMCGTVVQPRKGRPGYITNFPGSDCNPLFGPTKE